MLPYNVCFSASQAHVVWLGKQVVDDQAFRSYIRHHVRSYLFDEQQRASFEADIRALATTDMDTATLEAFLADETPKEDWEVGEALAHCLLTADYDICWPWNVERDKRTPKASLPGADLIGFIHIDGETFLALGEVKTSSDLDVPPGVMNGRSGMQHQLDTLAHQLRLHQCLINWLHARCKNTEFQPLFKRAVQNYLASQGRAIKLFGMLMRDTVPNERDLYNRAQALSRAIQSPTSLELCAWYFPCSIAEWVTLIQ